MKTKHNLLSFLPSGIALISLTLSYVPAQAASYTRNDTNTLTEEGAWTGTPGTADTGSYFTGSTITLAKSVNQTLGGNLSIGNLDVRQLQPIWIKADGNTLTLNSAVAANGTAGTCAIDAGSSNFSMTRIDCPISLAANATFRNSAGGWLTLNGGIGESSADTSLVLMAATSNGQPGSFLLTAPNSYSGGTFIGRLATATTAGSGTLVALSGSGTLGASGSALTMGTSANGTVLDLGGTTQTLGAVSFGSWPTVQNGGISGTSFSGFGLIDADLSGSGLYTLNNNNQRLILSGNNSYSGGTTITLGTLLATKPAALPLSGNISVAASASAILAIRAGGAGEWAASDLTNLLTYDSQDNGSLSIGNNGVLGIDTTGGNFSYTAIVGPTPANLGLTKLGPNTLTLTGASTYGKVTTINRGAITVDNTLGGSLASSSPLTFTGTGAFTYNTASTPQSLGALTLSGGEGTVQLTRSGTATLTFASLAARAAGRTANLSFNGDTPSASDGIQFASAPAGFINQGIFYNGADFAYMDAANTFVRNPVYGTDIGFEAADTITTGTHALLTTTPAAQSSVTLNTLKLSGSGVGFSLDTATDVLSLANGGILKTGGGSAGTISGGNVQATDSTRDLVVRTDSASDAFSVSSVLGAYAPSRTGNCTNASKIITGLSDTSDLYVGMVVQVQTTSSFGNNQPWTTITSIDSETQITVNNNFNLTTGSYTLVFSGNSLTKSGAGTLTLSGANNLVNVNLNGGQLNINSSTALGAAPPPAVGGNYGPIGTLTINEGTTIDNTSGAPLATLRYGNVWNGSFTFVGTDDLWLSTGGGGITIPNDITITTSTLGKTLKTGSGVQQTMARLTKRGPGTLQFDANGSQALMGGLNVYEGVYATSSAFTYWNSLSAGPIFLGDPAPGNSNNAVINCVRVSVQNSTITVNAGSSGTLALRSDGSMSLQSLLKLNNNLTLATPAGQTISCLGLISGTGTLNIGVPAGGLSSITVYDVSKSLNNAGTVRLLNENSYTGNTVINSGTFALGPLGSINSSANISIAAGTTLDVSQQTSPFTLSASNTLSASGTGTAVGTTAARIIGPSGGVVSFASRPITLTWAGDTSGIDTDRPALLVSQGELTLNNNAFTINGASTLGEGTYRLIQVGNGSSGTLNENVTPSYAVSGTAISGSNTNVISSDGSGNLILTVTAGSDSSYDTWATANGIDGEPFDDDFDNDGISNGMEYALGLDPTANSNPVDVISGNTITFTKGTDAIANGDVSWIIETSTTLEAGSWTEEVTQAAGDATPTITYTFTPGTPAKKFARLKVVQVP